MSKVTALTETTDPQPTDFLYLVDDPGGTPLSRRTTITNVSAAVDHDSLLNYVAGQHRIINDAGTLATELFSAAEIISRLAGKAAASHNHNASEINAGTLTHERGGLEADVSAYSGLVKISGGSTSQAVADTDYAAATHATRHQTGGADAIKIDDLAAADDNTDLNVSTTAHGLAPKLSNVATEFLNGTGGYTVPATGRYREIWIPASAMVARTTNGAASGSTELATNDVMLESFDFATGAEEGVGFWLALPDSWDAGTVKAKFYWTAASGSGTVKWDIAARAYANDDAIDQALGTEQTAAADTLLLANDMHETGATPALTVGGTAVAGEPIYWQITRDVAGDTLGVDAKLLGVRIQYNENAAGPSAW